MSDYIHDLVEGVKAKNPAEPEFHQAVEEVAESVGPVLDKHPEYRQAKIMERIIAKVDIVVTDPQSSGRFKINTCSITI